MSDQVVTLPSTEGPCEARRPRAKRYVEEPWEITYPWGGDRFFGTKPQVKIRMRQRIAEEEAHEG